MAYPVIADTYRVALDWVSSANGATATNVIHISAPGKTASQVWTELNAATAGHAVQFYPISGTASVQKVFITPLDGAGATQELGPLTNWVGGATSDYYPAASALLKFSTAARGRSYRGRMYLPFVAEGSQTDGVIVGSAAGYGGGWAGFFADMNTAGYQLVVASYALAAKTAVTAIVGELPLATQRRRQTRLR